MNSFKAIAILQKLLPAELDLLKEYISLKSTPCRPQVRELFQTLCDNLDNMPSDHDGISSLTGYPVPQLSDLMNKLLEHIEFFCVRQSILKETTDINFYRHLLAFYSERGLPSLFDATHKRIEKQIKSQEINFPIEHLDIYNYYTDIAIYDKVRKGRKLSISLSDYAPHLDVFYCLQKIKVICENVNRKNTSNTEYLNDTAMVIAFSKRYAKDYPLIETYIAIAFFLKTLKITEKKYEQIYNHLQTIPSIWQSYSERITLCHYLINMCLEGNKNGNMFFRKKFIELILFMEAQGLLLEGKNISAPIFNAVVVIGLKARGSVWVESFLEKYSTALPEECKAEITAYSEACILLNQKNYSSAENTLNRIDRSPLDIYFKINIQLLRIKIAVEESLQKGKLDISLVDNKLRNFGLFLSSKDNISLPNKKELQKFNLYVRKVVANYGIKARRNNVFSKLIKETQLVEREWLLSLYNK